VHRKPPASLYAAIAASLAVHAMLLWWVPQWELEAPDAAHAPIVATIEAETAAVPAAPPAPPMQQRPPVREIEPLAPRPVERLRPSPRVEHETPSMSPSTTPQVPAESEAEVQGEEGSSASLAAPEYAPAPKPGPPAIDPGSVDQYRVALNIAARKYRDYPRQARAREWDGRTTVRVRVDDDGTVREIVIARSSGHEILDQSALDMLRKAQRDTPIPAALRGQAFSVDVTVVFELKD